MIIHLTILKSHDINSSIDVIQYFIPFFLMFFTDSACRLPLPGLFLLVYIRRDHGRQIPGNCFGMFPDFCINLGHILL